MYYNKYSVKKHERFVSTLGVVRQLFLVFFHNLAYLSVVFQSTGDGSSFFRFNESFVRTEEIIDNTKEAAIDTANKRAKITNANIIS